MSHAKAFCLRSPERIELPWIEMVATVSEWPIRTAILK